MWRRRQRSTIPAATPGPSPWYLRGNAAPLPDCIWTDASSDPKEAAGAMVLTGPRGAVLLLDFHNYVLSLGQDLFLIWHQRHTTDEPTTAPVVLRLFALADLSPLVGNLVELTATMRQEGASFVSAAPARWEISLSTTVIDHPCTLAAEPELSAIDELLILCHSSAIAAATWERNNLALLVATPRQQRYQLYPQDWFNNGGFDYGYEWVTRVARDATTGRIHGEGIRIAPFVLDASLRNRM
jgi:hypothetical protein